MNVPFLQRPRKSKFISYFDKTPPGIVCPHFWILAHANNCPYACDYCYLQLTFRFRPEPMVFTNREDMMWEIRQFLDRPEPSLLNAGEICDALAFDPHTKLSPVLVEAFRNQARHILLLLTKSTSIENLLDLTPTPQVIVSFSLNASRVSELFEHGSPGPLQRLGAAAQLAKLGWRIRLRIDPIIPIPDWQDHYRSLMDEIFAQLPDRSGQAIPERITVGSLRFFPALLRYAKKKPELFGLATSQEGADGRFRLPPEQRLEAYSLIRSARPEGVEFGLCKETEALWRAMAMDASAPACNCAL